jgi:hypothetical protein
MTASDAHAQAVHESAELDGILAHPWVAVAGGRLG